MKYFILLLISTTLIAQDKYAIMFIGDDRTEVAKSERRYFDDAAKEFGLLYKWVLPSNPSTADTSGCKFAVDFICNYDKERKSINVMFNYSEIDGDNRFEISLSKENADFETDGKRLILELLKIGTSNVQVLQRMR
jgi:hypothetical protein